MKALYLAALIALTAAPASAHKVWANGDPVPEWVKASCCGPADAHQLTVDQVSIQEDGYHVSVDGIVIIVPLGDALPTQDGRYWIFYHVWGMSNKPYVYCFFAPLAG